MVTHMKTTVDIADALLVEAKRAAAEDGTTLRALIEQGLQEVLRHRRSPTSFRLRDASVGGNGLQESFRGADWATIRDAIYEHRGA